MRIIEETERIMAANEHWNPQSTPASRAEADKLLQLPTNCEECHGTGYVKPPDVYAFACLVLGARAPQRVICLTCGGSGKRP